MPNNELDNRRRAQGLLDFARVSREGGEARAAERALEYNIARERFVEGIKQGTVYRQIMAVMEDPTLDQLLSLFWEKVWRPKELVSEKRIVESQIKLGGRVIGIKKQKSVKNVEKLVPYLGSRKVLPLDPVGFSNSFPIGGVGVGRDWISPISAYMKSIGIVPIEEEIERRLPPRLMLVRDDETTSYDANWLARQSQLNRTESVRRAYPFYGGGHCGVIELRTPPPPGKMGDQGKLQIKVGSDFNSCWLVRLNIDSPQVRIVETLSGLGALQRKLAEILVENGVTSVD